MALQPRRRRAFAIAAVALSTALVSAAAVGAYMLLERPSYRMLGSLRQADLVRAYLLNPRLRRFARTLAAQDPKTDLFATLWDTNTGVLLSRRMYRDVMMNGVPRFTYKPDLKKLGFRTTGERVPLEHGDRRHADDPVCARRARHALHGHRFVRRERLSPRRSGTHDRLHRPCALPRRLLHGWTLGQRRRYLRQCVRPHRARPIARGPLPGQCGRERLRLRGGGVRPRARLRVRRPALPSCS